MSGPPSRRVGIRELKNRLPRYVREVREGLEVIITDRGRAVALISRLDDAPAESIEARLAQLAARGDVILPAVERRRRVRRVAASGTPPSQHILEDRR